MATAYATSASFIDESSGSTPIVIPKPTSLASGDMMVAVVFAMEPVSTMSPPAGWTLKASRNNATFLLTQIYAKVADSSDAAASNFTFTNNVSAGSAIGGFIIRLTGTSFTDANNVKVNIGDSPTDIDMAPFSADSVFLLGASWRAGASRTASGYAVTNNNPTWTEAHDISTATATRDGGGAIAYADVTAGGDSGDATVTISDTINAAHYFLIAVQESTSVTVTHTTLTQSPTFTKPALSVGVTATTSAFTMSPTINTPSVYGNAPSQYTNPDKSSTTWTNPDKP